MELVLLMFFSMGTLAGYFVGFYVGAEHTKTALKGGEA